MKHPLSLPQLALMAAAASAVAVLTVMSAPSLAAVDPAAGTPGHFLADRHVAKGMQCTACHDANQKLLKVGDNDICVKCHGDYPAMVKKTDGRFEVNPHAQHDGLLPCTECHKGHKAGVNYCGQCHNYTYKVP